LFDLFICLFLIFTTFAIVLRFNTGFKSKVTVEIGKTAFEDSSEQEILRAFNADGLCTRQRKTAVLLSPEIQ